MVLTPTYHVFKMYLPFQDATFVPAKFDAGSYSEGAVQLPRVDAIAARDTAGKLWLSVTNLDPRRPVRLKASLAGVSMRSVHGQLLTAPRIDSVNSFDKPDVVTPKPYSAKASGDGVMLELPAKSVLVVQVDS
jgi:alpha-N-arabinofuranosidase